MQMPLKIKTLKTKLKESRHFFEEELWYQELPPWKTAKGFGLRIARFIHLVSLGFREDQLRLHATALTYSTLMSLLPLLAIGLAIAKGLGQDRKATQYLLEYAAEMPKQFQDAVQAILDVVTQTDFGKLGAIGALILLFMIIQVLSRIEVSFNRVWGIRKSRSWLRRVTNYISIVVVVPILLIAAITVTATFKLGGELFEQLGVLRVMPFVTTWIAFSFLYGALPNTRVRIGPVLLSGLAGAVMWQLWFRFYINIQPGVTNYNVIYGALASVPIFLAWLYVGWMIVLLGAKITFAVQNGSTFHAELSRREASATARIQLALAVLTRAARSLTEGAKPFEKQVFAKRFGVNPLFLEEVLDSMVDCDLLAETGDKEGRYVLLRAPDRIMIKSVVRVFIDEGDEPESLGLHKVNPVYAACADSILGRMDLETKTIADLLMQDTIDSPHPGKNMAKPVSS